MCMCTHRQMPIFAKRNLGWIKWTNKNGNRVETQL